MGYLAKNIKFLRKLKSISSSLLADEIGIPRTTLSGYENNTTEPPVSVAYRISELFGIPLDVLLYKDLSAMGEDAVSAISDEKRLMPYSKPFIEKAIPLYNIPVTAGLGGVLDVSGNLPEVPDGYVSISGTDITKGAEAAFPVMGFSMEPTIKNGDVVVVRRIHSLEVLDTSSIYMFIVSSDGERMIKRFLPNDNEKFITCASDNHASFPLPKKEIAAVFKILAVLKPV